MAQIKNIGVFTSGGDAPGMNAAIRAVVRTALYYDVQVTGIRRGYEGMIKGELVPMDRKSVSNIIFHFSAVYAVPTCKINQHRFLYDL